MNLSSVVVALLLSATLVLSTPFPPNLFEEVFRGAEAELASSSSSPPSVDVDSFARFMAKLKPINTSSKGKEKTLSGIEAPPTTPRHSDAKKLDPSWWEISTSRKRSRNALHFSELSSGTTSSGGPKKF